MPLFLHLIRRFLTLTRYSLTMVLSKLNRLDFLTKTISVPVGNQWVQFYIMPKSVSFGKVTWNCGHGWKDNCKLDEITTRQKPCHSDCGATLEKRTS
ncbi:hypothetical protein AVEN_196129-1 [Araneus ventricosus]|uniref:Uncharacterized protein n=1 Tax=Araneus ventricosus TaxID=182803 RepID=A0A4Y2E4K8_ARAVE|nr:hypothetical protein AVEN_196129-1 [Araneus ventricosus]